MKSQVLWAIDNEIDSKAFERLSTDLLYRNGFKEIVPVEPQDAGRDAEEHTRRGRGRDGEAAFFQFSLEDNWKAKLRRDAKKLSEGDFSFQTLVFVTSSKVRGVDRDALAEEIRTNYGWQLIVFSREWLRLQLEEAQPDLAKKYLDVDVPAESAPAMKVGRLDPPDGERFAEAWTLFEAGKFERAAVTIKEVFEEHPEPDRRAYTVLAWCEYQIRRYDEALGSINRALAVKTSKQGRAISGCILVEKGIAMRDRVSLVEGKKLFEQLVDERVEPRWCQLFNLGNAQTALGDQHGAIASYEAVLKEMPDQVETLKNLGSAYHRVGEHAREIECFDRVLELEPLKWEALVSKAVSRIVDFNRASDGAELLEQALKFHPERAVHWPHAWFWLAEARRRSGDDAGALTALDEGLAHQPGHRAMWRLKSDILESMTSADLEKATQAEVFWQRRLESAPTDYATRERMMRLKLRQGDEASVWSRLDDHMKATGFMTAASLRGSGFSLEQCITALRFARQYLVFRNACPVSGYWVEDDPLYDLDFAAPKAGQIQEALTLFALVPFGLAFEALEASRDEADAIRRLQSAFDPLRVHLTQAISRAAQELAGVVPVGPTSGDAVPQKLAEVLMFMGLVALREFGKQRGWIASQFPISQADLNLAIDDYDESQILKDVTTESLLRLNDALRLFPK
jgi:tetratricopeptide (TPR) repeat protein